MHDITRQEKGSSSVSSGKWTVTAESVAVSRRCKCRTVRSAILEKIFVSAVSDRRDHAIIIVFKIVLASFFPSVVAERRRAAMGPRETGDLFERHAALPAGRDSSKAEPPRYEMS